MDIVEGDQMKLVYMEVFFVVFGGGQNWGVCLILVLNKIQQVVVDVVEEIL